MTQGQCALHEHSKLDSNDHNGEPKKFIQKTTTKTDEYIGYLTQVKVLKLLI